QPRRTIPECLMGFESLLLIVVVVEAVWILSSLFRGHEDERKGQRGRPAPRGPATPPQAARPRPAPTNVDRFLEEINRRRREAAERQSVEPSRPETAAPSERARTPSSRPETSRRRRLVAEEVVVSPLVIPPEPPLRAPTIVDPVVSRSVPRMRAEATEEKPLPRAQPVAR